LQLVGFRCGKTFEVATLRVVVHAGDKTSGDARSCSGKEENIGDDWDLLLDGLDFGDILDIKGVEVSSFVCKMGKNSRNKRKQLEKYQLIYYCMGPLLSTGKPLTQEEVEIEALAIDLYKRYSLLEEERPVIKTMPYSDKYKKIIDGICIDKMKLDEERGGRSYNQDQRRCVNRERGSWSIRDPIRLEGKINLNVLADTGFNINVMPYHVYKEPCREEVQNVKRGITMLNHSKAEPMRLIKDILCQNDSDDAEEYSVQRNNLEYRYTDQNMLVPLQHVDWKPDYTRCFNGKEDGDA
nr:hypothetical protein [Tanacetum cinerariifolium]